MPQEKAVGSIIYRIDKSSQGNGKKLYLLLKYKAKHWDFVKGHIDPGETDEQTLRREAKEETGIGDLNIKEGFKEYTKFIFKQYKELMTSEQKKSGKPVWVFKIVNFYLAETQTKDVKLSEEHQDYKWLKYDEALAQTTYKGSKDILRKAHEFILNNKI